MRIGSELRPRMTLRVDGALCRVVSADYHGGQGKMGGVMHAKLRDLPTGKERERRFRAEETVEELPGTDRTVRRARQDEGTVTGA